MNYIAMSDPLATDVVAAIQLGDVDQLKRLLLDNPTLASSRLRDSKPGCGESSRTLLLVASDLPGLFPSGPETVAVLVAAGADVNAPSEGKYAETPLHWAASSDDVAVLDALLDNGANIEAPGAVIGGGTPLADAAGFGQWRAARATRGVWRKDDALASSGARPDGPGTWPFHRDTTGTVAIWRAARRFAARRSHARLLVGVSWRAAANGGISLGSRR
jgi:hypothetical protein